MTTYDFYTGKYYGDIIPEIDFARYESRAVDDLNDFTFGRLKGKANIQMMNRKRYVRWQRLIIRYPLQKRLQVLQHQAVG